MSREQMASPTILPRCARLGGLVLALSMVAPVTAQPLAPGARVRIALSDASTSTAWTLGRVVTATGDTLVLDLPDGRRFGYDRSEVLTVEVDRGRPSAYWLAPASGAVLGLVAGAAVADVVHTPEPEAFLEVDVGHVVVGALVGAVVGYLAGGAVGRAAFPVRWERMDPAP